MCFTAKPSYSENIGFPSEDVQEYVAEIRLLLDSRSRGFRANEMVVALGRGSLGHLQTTYATCLYVHAAYTLTRAVNI